MKKNILLLTLILPLGLATGCGQEPVISDTTIELTEKHLDDLAKGFVFETKATITTTKTIGVSKEEVSKQIIQTEAKEGMLTYLTYKSVSGESVPNKDELLLAETWVRHEIDNVNYACMTRLGMENETLYYRVQNPVKNTYYEFDKDGFDNPFKKLDVKDFTLVDGKYELILGNEELTDVYQAFSNNIYGDAGLVLESLALEINSTKVTGIDSVFTFKGSNKKYTYEFSTTVVKTAPLYIQERVVPYEPVTDEKFSKALELLKAQNYELTQADQVFEESGATTQVSLTTAKVTPTSYERVTKAKDETSGEIVTKHSEAGIKLENGYKNLLIGETPDSYIDNGELSEEYFNDHYPKFNLDRAVFDYDPDNEFYVLKNDVSGDLYRFTAFEGIADNFAKLGIRIASDYSTVEFQAIQGDKITLVTFSNFGKVNPITEDKISKPGKITWDLLLNTKEAYDKLNTNVGPIIPTLPIPENLIQAKSWADLHLEEPTHSLLFYTGDTSVSEASVTAYVAQLEEAGFTSLGEDVFGLEAGIGYSIEVDANTYIVQPAYAELGGSFCFVICIANLADF